MSRLLAPYKNVLLALILASLTIGMVAGWQYSDFRQNVKRYGTEIVTLISSIPYEELSTLDARDYFLKPAVTNSPSPTLTYVQIFDGSRQVLNQYANDPAIIPASGSILNIATHQGAENRNDGIIEFYAPIMNGSSNGAFVRVGFDTNILGYFTVNIRSLIAGLAPSILLVGLFLLYQNRKKFPVDESYELMRRLLRKVPHDESGQTHRVDPVGNVHNLKLLVNSTEAYLKKVESERATLNTSTKVLAYQKFNSESILRSVPDAVLVLDESGQVTFANQQFLRWYRLGVEDVVGKMPSVWCERPGLLGFLRRYSGMLARRAESGSLESDPPGKPGSTLSVTAYPMFSSRDEQHINSTLIVFSDVTTEVLAQKARDEFAAALAHELKTPLHSIGLHAELLMGEDGEDASNRIDSANFINIEVEHIGELVRNMLNITRIETGSLSINRKLTKIGDLLKNAIDNLSVNAEENEIQIITEMPDTVEPGYFDKDLLRIAINNLLSNAIKYNKPGGDVTVTLTDNDNSLSLSVADTGIGMVEEDRERIFDKFYRSEDEEVRSRSGHGLGLSLVKEIIELHNGTVSVESTIGEGTKFTVRLKRINMPLQEAA